MKHIFRRLAAALLLCGLLAGCVACAAAPEPGGELTVTFLDVGKGDCILLEKDGTYVLIDAGYDSTADDVIAFLQQAGVERLDYFIITHYDKDHVGGAAAVAESFSVGQIYLPGYEGESRYYTAFMDVIAENALPAENVTKNVSFTLAGVRYEIYASELEYVFAAGEDEGNDNDVSLVIAAYYGRDSYLFAGDIEKDGIKSYLAAGHGTFDVVKMPHHGRKESNSDDFIDDTQMQIAVITDSADDEADSKILKWLGEAEAAVYRSSECGTIVVTSTGAGEYAVKTNAA